MKINASFQKAIHQLRPLFDDLEEIYFFAKDCTGKFLYSNPSHLHHLGQSSLKSLLGKTDSDFYPSILADRFKQDDLKVIRSQTPLVNRIEIVRNRKGEMRWHSTTKTPYRDRNGKIGGLIGITRDLQKSAALIRKYDGLNQVIEKIDRSFDEPLKSQDLANEIGLSIRQLERRFRSVMGKSPRTFLLERRLEEAHRQLTQTKEKITTIALSSGFFDHSHFCKAFKASFGVSPQAVRSKEKSV